MPDPDRTVRPARPRPPLDRRPPEGRRGRQPPSGLTVRPCRPAEVPVVLAVWLAAGAVPGVTDDAASLHQLLAVSGDGLLVAELRGRVVGTLIAGWDGWRGNFYRLAVLPEHRRRGVARRLVAEGERRLVEKGARRASALVVGVEAPAMAFWHAAGFQLDARMERFVKPLGDRPGG